MAKILVGIDVSHQTLSVCFLNQDENLIRPISTFPNDPEGWSQLEKVLASLARPGTHIVCGFEATANMHKRLEEALRRSPLNLEVHVLSPAAVNFFSRALQNNAKTDRLDALTIARFLSRMKPSSFAVPKEIEQLRQLTRSRRKLIEFRSQVKNSLHFLLRYWWPGYQAAFRRLPKRFLLALINYPSPHLMLKARNRLARLRIGPRHLVGEEAAQKLLALAEFVPEKKIPESACFMIKTTARRILELEAEIAHLETLMTQALERTFPQETISTIPGISKVTAAVILAEVGDISRFPSKKKFIGYTGLYPGVWESGQSKRRTRMSRKGNSMLKMAFLLASVSARRSNPRLKAFYERLLRRGKSKRAAGGAVARKLAEIVYALLVSGERWSAEKAKQALSKEEEMSQKSIPTTTSGAAWPTFKTSSRDNRMVGTHPRAPAAPNPI